VTDPLSNKSDTLTYLTLQFCPHCFFFPSRLFSHQHDDLNLLSYPKAIFQRKTSKHKCRMCNFNAAHFITVDDRLAGETPCYFCEECYYDFHYDHEGTLLYDDFRVFRYNLTEEKE
jgi:snRNA-activating protein complex subunit 3